MRTYQGIEDFLQKGKEFFGELSKGLQDCTLSIIRQTGYLSSYDNQVRPLYWTQYCLSSFPGCCGILVSHASNIIKEYRGFGLGDYFHKERLQLAKDMGYSCVTCTTISSNEAEIKILQNNGWKKVHEFKNSRTGNTVHMWVKDI